MGKRIGAKITLNRFGDVSKEVHQELARIVPATAAEVKADAQASARVQTGSMRDSVYVLTRGEDGYGEAVAAAESDNPGVPVFDALERPQSDTEALVPVAVAHAERIEMGVHPFLTPAAEDNRPAFEYDVRQGLRAAIRRVTTQSR